MLIITTKMLELPQIGRMTISTSNGLVVNALDSQSRSHTSNSTEWLQGQLSLSSFRGRSIENRNPW